MPRLLDLPLDILFLLPAYLDDIRALVRLKRTCKALHLIFRQTLPRTILRLVARSPDAGQLLQACGQTRPLAHILALAVARQVADWAVGDPLRTARLRGAFAAGSRGILELGLDVAGLTLAEVRELYWSDSGSSSSIASGETASHKELTQSRRHIGKVLDRMVACVIQCHRGDQEDRVMLRELGMAADMVYHMAIYGELFRPSMLWCTDQNAVRLRFPGEMRRAYIANWPALSEATSSSVSLTPAVQTAAGNSTFSPDGMHHRPAGQDLGRRRDSATCGHVPEGAAEDAEASGEGMTLRAIFHSELLSLADNKAWHMKWRTALHAADMLSSQSSAADDVFWISTMQSCGLAGADLWSALLAPDARAVDEGSMATSSKARWADERRGLVAAVQATGGGVQGEDWPDLWKDVQIVLEGAVPSEC
ncbi:hypothetical protein Micbo1qcDRAFT_204059 [Microdochium bolleyi]|uniref:F-box domain-containing protein n=1 Tax=Microdochium bolleyi TaxID=196109 RepID=A0A136J466_9PEZI|nr:hypothetical protein Micbo1qcDRAFT_204059 [Microdochium bolleyi]